MYPVIPILRPLGIWFAHSVPNSRSFASLKFPVIPNVVYGGEVPPLAAQGLLRAWVLVTRAEDVGQGGSEERKVERHTPEDVGNQLGQRTPHHTPVCIEDDIASSELLRAWEESLIKRTWVVCGCGRGWHAPSTHKTPKSFANVQS